MAMPDWFTRLARWWRGPDQRLLDPGTRLLDLDGFRPEGYACGIEVLNDAGTPMGFVVAALVQHAGLAQKDAVQSMCRIHLEGGALLPLPSEAQATRVAAAIEAMAREAGHPLVCRAACVHTAAPDPPR